MAPLNYMQSLVIFLGILAPAFKLTGAQTIGVCYGRKGNNLPSEQATVDLYGANQIKRMRLYDPVREALDALRGKDIEIILDVPLTQLEFLQDTRQANQWVQDNILNYGDVKFRYIAVGNEVDPGNQETSQYVRFVLPAMQNVHAAIVDARLQDQVKVSTATYSGLIDINSSPPSVSSFKASATDFIQPIIQFLSENNLPLLANIYPYFSYIRGGGSLDYALFRPAEVVQDGSLPPYTSLFDALVDVMYSAVEKAGGANIEIVVSESGWPSAGEKANPQDAGTYYRNLIQHVKMSNGTPKKQGKPVETYLFAMYDENDKQGEEGERHFGIFDPVTKLQHYDLDF